jgi:uncharacterized protein (DUF488 family)
MEAMAVWVPDLAGAEYEWARALGGFRKARPDSPNTGLRHPSFRGYADYMQTQPFLEALDALVTSASTSTTAIMCSETLWWRCHRRLIADALTLLRGVEVRHLLHDGSRQEHALTESVRRIDGVLQYG